ncbi:MAG: BamA/TamA family outer membrane protein, partial [Bacteroidota bacterium]
IIDAAIEQLPPEVRSLTSDQIGQTLKIRRDQLATAIEQYYTMLAKYIDLVGSDAKEYFALKRLENGDVEAKVFKLKKGKKQGRLLYYRLFKKQETQEIRLHGLGQEDYFDISGTAKRSILIRVIGGEGQDIIQDRSSVKGLGKLTKIYDHRQEDQLLLEGEAKKVFTARPLVLDPQQIYKDNYLVVLPYLAYNLDDGLIIGLAGRSIVQGFNKPDFKVLTSFKGEVTTMGNYGLKINTQFRHWIRQWDLVMGINAVGNDRNFQRFYGIGNETILDESLRDADFYENNTASVDVFVGLRRDFFQRSFFTTTLIYDYNEVISESKNSELGSIYDQLPPNNGLGKTHLFGLEQSLDLDFRNERHFPTKGTQFRLQNYTFFNPSLNWETGGRLESELSAFFTKGKKLPITLSLKGGVSKAYGDVPFYHLSYLGQQSNHRGFLRNRFAGETAAFLNTDLRIHFGTKVTSIIPIKYGIFGLCDLGRVWSDAEASSKLHTAFGGGFYLIPYKESANLTFTFAHSDQNDLLFSFRIGFFVK